MVPLISAGVHQDSGTTKRSVWERSRVTFEMKPTSEKKGETKETNQDRPTWEGQRLTSNPSPLKLPWRGRAPTNRRGTLSFFYKMGGPGRQHLYKMECAKKTVQNDRAYTKTGDSWWIEKFEVISIMFGEHRSMYQNKVSFCRHLPGHYKPLRHFFSTHFVEVMVPR